jgi:hypothetical protein
MPFYCVVNSRRTFIIEAHADDLTYNSFTKNDI